MKRFLQVMRALVIGRPTILIVLALFYLVGVFMVAILEPGRRGVAIGLLAIIPTAGFFGIATERALQYSLAGGSLGIPDHARAIRQGQIGVAALFLLTPVLFGVLFGGQLSWMMLLCVPAALGTLLALYPRWAFGAWILFAVGGRLFSNATVGWLLQSLWFRAALTAGGVLILGRWLRLGVQAEQRGKWVSSGLADRKHERRMAGDASLQRPSQESRLIDAMAAEVVERGLTPSVLCAALALDVLPRWRATLGGIGLGWTASAIAHELFQPDSVRTVFFVITALAATQLLVVMNLVHNAWKARGPEQRLLVLTPRWPAPQTVKRVFVKATLASQISPWVVWTLIVIPLGVIGWVEMKLVGLASLCLLAATSGGCGAMWVALAQRRAKEVSVGRIALLLCSAAGAALSVWGLLMSSWTDTVGFAMILAPAIVGIIALSYRPIQFPVEPVEAT